MQFSFVLLMAGCLIAGTHAGWGGSDHTTAKYSDRCMAAIVRCKEEFSYSGQYLQDMYTYRNCLENVWECDSTEDLYMKIKLVGEINHRIDVMENRDDYYYGDANTFFPSAILLLACAVVASWMKRY